MPFENLTNNHYLPAEKTTVATALASLETTLLPRIKNLSAEERQKYGSINETNKLIVNKAKEYRASQPTLSSPDVDWVEFAADYADRSYKQAVLTRLATLTDGLTHSKILQDYDNYQAALTDYDYSKYKASANAQGFNQKVAEIAQFFSGGANNSADTSPDNA